VNSPKHYTSHPSGVECIEITQHYNFTIGNAIKYLWRQGLKDEASIDPVQKQIEDLNKAVWYIQKEIQNLKEGVYNGKSMAQAGPQVKAEYDAYGKIPTPVSKCCSRKESRDSCDSGSTQDGPEYSTRSVTGTPSRGFWNVRFADWHDGAPTMKLDKVVSINYNMNHGTQWNGVSVSGWDFYFGKGTNATV
jgi:hypothetical protein